MQKRKLKILVNGKINLSLNILGTYGGYHQLDTIMASVNITDAITICERFDSKVNIIYNNFYPNGLDTATKAINVLRKHFGDFGVDVVIDKNIPLMAGMGGSSADAAGVIMALDNLYDFSSRGVSLSAIASSVGSDVPYMLKGGYSRVLGVGETVNYFDSELEFCGLIIMGKLGVNTKEAYNKFDELFASKKCVLVDNNKVETLLKNNDMSCYKLLDNALYAPSRIILPEIDRSMELAYNIGAKKVFMTGSGAGVVALFDNEDMVQAAKSRYANNEFFMTEFKTKKTGITIL